MPETKNKNSSLSKEIAKDVIRSFEGLRLKAYICPSGKKTIGYGHVVNEKEQKLQLISLITKEIAEELLEHDIEIAQNAIYRYCKIEVSSKQEAALISFIFNCGIGAFQASSLRQKLNRGEHRLAASEFPKWVYSRGIRLAGLTRRRFFEQKLFLSGIVV